MVRIKLIVVMFILVNKLVLCNILPSTQSLIIGGQLHTIDINRLLYMTQMMESRGGKDKYTGKIAKTSYQYELDTANYYLDKVPELKNYIEKNLGRKLNLLSENDAKYICWLIYMAKLRYHKNWLDKYYNFFLETGDTEWLVYKVLWNSIKGKSNYNTWNIRLKQYIDSSIGGNEMNYINNLKGVNEYD